MPGTLYIVATPIGNLEDITQRALRVLREVAIVACEDTRRTRVLLDHFGISTKSISYHEHNERERTEQLCDLLESGKDVALVSDAGTPLISDPGFRIVTAAAERGIQVMPIPGAAAFVAALVASGLPSDQFFFAGFLPARASQRRTKLDSLRTIQATLIFYEAPHRIAATLKDAFDVLGNRRAAVARELTKLHEEIARGNLSELLERFSPTSPTRGEIVLMISGRSLPSTAAASGPEQLIELVTQFERDGVDSKDALKLAARALRMKRADAYRTMVAEKRRQRTK